MFKVRSFKAPEPLLEALTAQAAREQITRGELIRRAVRRYLESAKNGGTQ